MRLSKRIYDICSLVSKGESVADIGTDHAYVPMYLVKNNIVSFAIMSDISEDSLQKAKETFKKIHLNIDESLFRVGDGLQTIKMGEVDTLIIAGLGGYTIIDILNENLVKSTSFKKLILQPRKFSGELRYYLVNNGWKIINEILSPEGKFICEIIVAIPEQDKEINLFEKDDIRWSYPDTFSDVNYNLLKKRLDWKFDSMDEEIINLKSSNSDTDNKIRKINKDKEYLKKLLENCKNNNFG